MITSLSDAGRVRPADALVIFGITGDLAKVMTFRSLYRLEKRGLLSVPIIGVAVDEWDDDRLRRHAHDAILAGGEPLDEQVFQRLAGRLSYLAGDLVNASTYGRLRRELAGADVPVFYLETPPSLFGTVVAGLADAELTGSGRVILEKPFGHDLDSARHLAADLHQCLDEAQIYRIDHFLGKMGLDELLYLRFANTMFEPAWSRHHVACIQITLAEDFGVEDRGRFYDPVGALRDVVVNHLMQLVAAVTMEAPTGRDPESLVNCQLNVFKAVRSADPSHCVRGQYDGYLTTDGVSPTSTTETFVALRLDIDNWRWSGVPIYIRTGKHLAVTQTEVRLVFTRPPRLGFGLIGNRRPEPNQLVVRLDPATGVRLTVDAERADTRRPGPVNLDMTFARQGGEGPTPYEVLLHAALVGDPRRFTRQDGLEEAWRIVQPLLDQPPPLRTYAPGSWGPSTADGVMAGHGNWHPPWVGS